MNRIAAMLLVISLGTILTGCSERELRAESPTSPKPKDSRSASEQNAIFAPPAPIDVSQEPQVITSKAASENINQALSVIRKRLFELRATYEMKVKTEQDLQTVIPLLKRLLTSARSDCDMVLRTAKDLRNELRYARKGYESTAELYRDRAKNFKDKALKQIEMNMAAEFEKVADDIPRRVRLTDEFIEGLIETQEFLAETDRCLSDTKAALSILSVGPEPVKISAEGKAFRTQLDAFIFTVDNFQRMLLTPPSAPKVEKNSNEKETTRAKPQDEAKREVQHPTNQPKEKEVEKKPNESKPQEKNEPPLKKESIEQQKKVADEVMKSNQVLSRKDNESNSFASTTSQKSVSQTPQYASSPGWRPVSSLPPAAVIETRSYQTYPPQAPVQYQAPVVYPTYVYCNGCGAWHQVPTGTPITNVTYYTHR